MPLHQVSVFFVNLNFPEPTFSLTILAQERWVADDAVE
jgi:hypothetical protein